MRILLLLIIPLLITLGCSRPDSVNNTETESKTDSTIEFYQSKLMEDPTSYSFHNKLAQAYIQKARETGNIDYYEKAKASLEISLKINPKNYNGLVYMAMANASEHNFKEALKYAKIAVELNPDKSYGFGVLGDAYLELGQTRNAEKAYEKMIELKPGLDSYSRLSNLRDKKGDIQGAVKAMEKAYEAGLKDSRTSKENLSWTQVMIGAKYLDQAQYDKAEEYFSTAVEIKPDYYLALEHLAEVKAIKGNFEEAISLYEKTLELAPKPEFYVALANVYKNQGNNEKAQELYRLADTSDWDRTHGGLEHTH